MGLGTHECIHLTEHKTFAQMKNEQIANLLAQIATNQIDENEVADILREQYSPACEIRCFPHKLRILTLQ